MEPSKTTVPIVSQGETELETQPNLQTKNQALAAEDRALKETSAPSSDKVVTGELGMSDKDVAARHERARQQGTAQHSEAAHELKQAIFADNPEAGANRAS